MQTPGRTSRMGSLSDPSLSSSRTGFLKKEIKILEEIVNVLSKPTKYGISDKDIFTVFNSSSSMLDNIVNGPKLTSSASSNTSSGSGNNGQSISTKMVDFQNLVALGQQLADKRKIIKIDSPTAVKDSLMTVSSIYKTLSRHVYINHVKSPASTAAVNGVTSNTSSTEVQNWWTMMNSSKPISKSFDPKNSPYENGYIDSSNNNTNGSTNSVNDSSDNNSVTSSTNPLESHDYFPDLRLVLKNVLILFISFFKRYDELITSVPSVGKLENELMKSLKDLMLLLNVSILNKLVEIFKMLNPRISLKTENDIFGVLAQ